MSSTIKGLLVKAIFQSLTIVVGPLLIDLVRALVIQAEALIPGEKKGDEKYAFVAASIDHVAAEADIPDLPKAAIRPLINAAAAEMDLSNGK